MTSPALSSGAPRRQRNFSVARRAAALVAASKLESLDARCIESYAPHTVDTAILPPAYSTKIALSSCSTATTIRRRQAAAATVTRQLSSNSIPRQRNCALTNYDNCEADTAHSLLTRITHTATDSDVHSQLLDLELKHRQRTLTVPRHQLSVSPPTASQPLHRPQATHPRLARKLTHFDTVEGEPASKKTKRVEDYSSAVMDHQNQDSWPRLAPTSCWPDDFFDDAPSPPPELLLQLPYTPATYSKPQQQYNLQYADDASAAATRLQYPYQEQEQQQQLPQATVSQEAQFAIDEELDRLIEGALLDEQQQLDVIDIDDLVQMLDDEEEQAEQDPLREFFPALPSTSTATSNSATANSSAATSVSNTTSTARMQPMERQQHQFSLLLDGDVEEYGSSYHEMTTVTTTTTTMMKAAHAAAYEWPETTTEWLETNTSLAPYLEVLGDSPSTSSGSPTYYTQAYYGDNQQQQYGQSQNQNQQMNVVAYPHHQSHDGSVSPPAPGYTTQAVATARPASNASSTNSYSGGGKSARHTPYPAGRPLPFRPDGFGLPSAGETVDDYRTRRDKNNESSARSRRKKADKIACLKEEQQHLQHKNIELKERLANLEREVKDYKELMLTTIRA